PESRGARGRRTRVSGRKARRRLDHRAGGRDLRDPHGAVGGNWGQGKMGTFLFFLITAISICAGGGQKNRNVPIFPCPQFPPQCGANFEGSTPPGTALAHPLTLLTTLSGIIASSHSFDDDGLPPRRRMASRSDGTIHNRFSSVP